MVTKYPHKMTLTITTGSTQDSNGDWIAGTTMVIEKECRAEPSGGNGYISGPDGSKINYSWIVYMPLPVDKILEGVTIEVIDKKTSESILKDKVIRFSRGQLNARLWL